MACSGWASPLGAIRDGIACILHTEMAKTPLHNVALLTRDFPSNHRHPEWRAAVVTTQPPWVQLCTDLFISGTIAKANKCQGRINLQGESLPTC